MNNKNLETGEVIKALTGCEKNCYRLEYDNIITGAVLAVVGIIAKILHERSQNRKENSKKSVDEFCDHTKEES